MFSIIEYKIITKKGSTQCDKVWHRCRTQQFKQAFFFKIYSSENNKELIINKTAPWFKDSEHSFIIPACQGLDPQAGGLEADHSALIVTKYHSTHSNEHIHYKITMDQHRLRLITTSYNWKCN